MLDIYSLWEFVKNVTLRAIKSQNIKKTHKCLAKLWKDKLSDLKLSDISFFKCIH